MRRAITALAFLAAFVLGGQNVDTASGGPGFGKWYYTTGKHLGANADTACGAGEHMCLHFEMWGKSFDAAATVGVRDTGVFFDTDSNKSSTMGADCNNWSSSSGAVLGMVVTMGNFATPSDLIDGNWYTLNYSAFGCNSSKYVACCSDTW